MFLFVLLAIQYQSNFISCPSKSAGSFVVELVSLLEKKRSLYKLKKNIKDNDWLEKYFIEEYHITYNWVKDRFTIDVKCSRPIMQVQVYKESIDDFHAAILVDSGKLYDPIYASLLREEKKLNRELPYLAIPIELVDSNWQKEITSLVNFMPNDLKDALGEIILNREGELTMIISLLGESITIFLGKDELPSRLEKLVSMLKFFKKQGSIPSIISMISAKKFIVKFNHKS